MSDGEFWSEPAIIVVAVNGINDNPPVISVTPSGLVSVASYMSALALICYVISSLLLKGALQELMLLLQLIFLILTMTSLWKLE